MPRPIALCLENLATGEFVSCIAIRGNAPGLGLAADGAVGWQQATPACELFVSADEKLIALRRDGAPEVVIERAGRRLSAPVGKPVVLLDQDQLTVGSCALRLHVHGEAEAAVPPQSLGVIARAAAAAAVGAVLVGGACLPPSCGADADKPIDVREQPPAPMPTPPEPIEVRPHPPAAPIMAPLDAGRSDQVKPDAVKPIEVRTAPPKPVAPHQRGQEPQAVPSKAPTKK